MFKVFIPLTYKPNLVNINLYHNVFPKHFTDISKTDISKTLNTINSKHSNSMVPNKLLYFPISYTGPRSLQLRHKVLNLINEYSLVFSEQKSPSKTL